MFNEIKGRDITKKNITALFLAFFVLFCSLIVLSASDKLAKQSTSSLNFLRLAEQTILDGYSKLPAKNSPMLNEDILSLIQNRREHLFDNLSSSGDFLIISKNVDNIYYIFSSNPSENEIMPLPAEAFFTNRLVADIPVHIERTQFYRGYDGSFYMANLSQFNIENLSLIFLYRVDVASVLGRSFFIELGLMIAFFIYALFRIRQMNASVTKVIANQSAKFSKLLDSIGVGVTITDVENYEFKYLNKKARTYFGENAVNTKCYSHCADPDNPLPEICSWCDINRIKEKTALGQAHEWEQYHKDLGLWFKKFDSMLDWADDYLSKLTVYVDISELRRLENELKENISIINSTRNFINIIDLKNHKYTVTPALCKLSGYSKEFLENTDPLAYLFSPDKRDLLTDEVLPILEHTGSWAGKMELSRKNGDDILVDMILFRIEDHKMNFIGIGAIVQDISAQLELERRIVQLASAFEASPNLIMSFGMDNRILTVNKHCYTISGYLDQELLGMDYTALYLPDQRNQLQSAVNSVITTRRPFNMETKIIHKSGSFVPVNQVIFCIIDEQTDEIVSIAAILQDITELIQMRHEIRVQLSRQEALSLISMKMMENISFKEKFDYFMDQVSAHFMSSAVGVFSYNPASQKWETNKNYSDTKYPTTDTFIYALDKTDAYSHFSTEDYMILSEIEDAPGEYAQITSLTEFRSKAQIIFISIKVNRRLVACIGFDSSTSPETSHLRSQDFLSSLHGIIVMAVETKIINDNLIGETLRMNSIYSASDSLLIYTDANLNILNTNSRFVFSKEESLNKNLRDIIAARFKHDPKHAELLLKGLSDALANKKSLSYLLHTVSSKTKNDIYLNFTVYPVLSEDNTLLGLTIFANDETEQRKKEAELKRMQKAISALVSSMPMSLWMLDTHSEIISIDGNLFDEMYFRELIYDDSLELNSSIHRSLGGESITIMLKDEYTKKYINHYISPFHNGDDLILGIVGVSVDVSDIKEMEYQLLQLNQRLEMAINVSKAGVWDIDVSDITVFCDANTLSLCGIEPSSPAVSFEDFSRALLENRSMPEFQEVIKIQNMDTPVDEIYCDAYLENKSEWPDGTIHYNITFMRALLNEKRQFTKIFGISLDNTAHTELAIQLIESKEKAEAASSAKTLFLSKMSHEIRTPMNAIMGMTKIAQRSESLQQIKACLDKIDISSEHLLNIINDILDMSKIESGKFQLYNNDFELADIVKDIVTMISVRTDEKKQNFSVFVSPEMPQRYFGDSTRLSQVLINLLSNAVKFTPDNGKISMRITLDSLAEDDALLRFAVSDSGIGMTPEQVEKIFNTFEQADGSITRKFGGTGLGLAISRNIVEMMDGVISVISEPHEGSTFAFTARFKALKSEAKDDSDEPFPARRSQQPDTIKLPGKTILLVEDVYVNAEIVIEYLRDTEMIIDWAEDGEIAVQKFKENPSKYDLILMDVQMPNKNGYIAAKEIRESGFISSETIPIVAMTANAFVEDIEKERSSGMNAHIDKPIKEEQMFGVIKKYLLGAEAKEPAQAVPPKPIAANISEITLDGINTKEALSRVRGNENLYKRLLKSFRDNNSMAEIRRLFSEGDSANFVAKVHSLKGASMNLGLVHVAETAEALEIFSQNGSLPKNSLLLDELEAHYEKAIKSINILLER